MSFRRDLLKSIDKIRSIAGPLGLDIRNCAVTIRTRTWSGGRIGLGTATDVDLELPGHYPIRYVAAHEVQAAAGQYETGDIIVKHITPSDGAGNGFTPEQLKPLISTNGVEVIHVLSGDHAGDYRLIELRVFRPFSYEMLLRRRMSTP